MALCPGQRAASSWKERQPWFCRREARLGPSEGQTRAEPPCLGGGVTEQGPDMLTGEQIDAAVQAVVCVLVPQAPR